MTLKDAKGIKQKKSGTKNRMRKYFFLLFLFKFEIFVKNGLN